MELWMGIRKTTTTGVEMSRALFITLTKMYFEIQVVYGILQVRTSKERRKSSV